MPDKGAAILARRRRRPDYQPRVEPQRYRRAPDLFTTPPRDLRSLRSVRVPVAVMATIPTIPGSARTRAKKISTARRRVKPALLQARPTLRAPVRTRNDPIATAAVAKFEERIRRNKPADMTRRDYLEMCARRRLRKQVIHAKGKAGAGQPRQKARQARNGIRCP